MFSRFSPLLALLLSALPPEASSAGSGSNLVREERLVVVGGVTESWRLSWRDRPYPLCGPNEPEVAVTCPCSGFAYGEEGHLILERSSEGRRIDSIDLAGLFPKDAYYTGFSAASSGLSALRRWNRLDTDPISCPDEDPQCKAFEEQVHNRPAAEVMELADYDHGGRTTEFLVQVGNMPCGKHVLALVGISKTDPKLHYFRTTAHPERPLTLKSWEWKALLEAHGTAVTVMDWPCGDHGAEVATELVLSATDGDIRVHSRTLACSGTGPGKIISESDE